MNPKQFLLVGGIVLLAVGILGMVGVLGPTPEQSIIFHGSWWFDTPENIAHTVLGIAALLAAYLISSSAQKGLTILVGLLALFFAAYGGMYGMFGSATLENPADTILHLVVGVWALWAAYRKPSMMM